MAVISGLAKDPNTGLNKFQQQQQVSQQQVQAAGGFKPGMIVSQPTVGAGAAGGVGAAAGSAVLGAGGGAKPGAVPAVGGAAGGVGGAGGYMPPQYQSSYNGPDMKGMTDQLNSIYSNMSASQLQKLKDALAVQLQGYNSQETTANQSAYDNRNSNDVMSMQQMQAVREQMAAQGVNGGDSITAQVAGDASRQNGANQINRDQANAIQDLAQKRALAQSQEASGELSLQQQIDSDKAGAMLNLLQYGDSRAFDVDQAKYGRFSDDLARQFQQSQFDYGKTQDQINNDAQYGGTYKGGQTYAAQQQQIANDAQYGGTYSGQKTVAEQQRQWANDFDYGNATGTFKNGQQTLASKGQQFDQGMTTKNYNRGVLESDRNYNRGVLESDRNYGRGVYESDRNYGRGVTESDRNYGLSQDDNDRQWASLDYSQSNGAGSKNAVSGAAAGDILTQSLQKVIGNDPSTGKPVYGTINNPKAREQAFVDAWNATGVAPGADTIDMLSKAGYTSAEIAQFKKDYPQAFQPAAQ